MTEGSGSKTFSTAKKFLYTQPQVAHALLQKITDASIHYVKNQVKAGAALIQIFDSWAGILSPAQYEEFSLAYIRQIVKSLEGIVPVTVFAKDAWFALEGISESGCQVVGLDWTVTPAHARLIVGEKQVLQGNLDPCCLYADFATIRKATLEMIDEFGGNHIVNLGHGVYPDTPLDGVKCFVDTVKSMKYEI
jgi:uroporphyrinogen decarboxylase